MIMSDRHALSKKKKKNKVDVPSMLSQTSPMPLLIATLPLANLDHCMWRLLSVSVFAGSLSLALSLSTLALSLIFPLAC